MAPGRARIEQAVGSTMRRHQAAVADFDREVARILGVNETDLRCLEILLQDVSEAAPSELATRLGLTTGSVTTMLDRLEALGYLARSPHPTDRRRTIVRATSEIARRSGELFAPLVEEGSREMLPRYTVAELEVIVDFLRRATALQDRQAERLRAQYPRRGRGGRASGA